jgi:AraC-like DNA-binding protein
MATPHPPRINYRLSAWRLLQGMRRHAVDSDALLQRAGIAPRQLAADGVVRGRQYIHLLSAVKETLADEFFGLCAHRVKPGAQLMLADVALACDNLGAAMEQAVRFLELITDDVEFRFEVHDDEAELRFSQQRPDLDPGGFMADYWLLNLHRAFSWMVGLMIPVKRVELMTMERPSRDHIAWLLRGDWLPGQARNAFFFSRKYLSLPIVRTRQEWREHVEMARQGMLDWPDDESSYSTQVKALLMQAINRRQPLPGLDEVAATLATTTQTLRRHLLDEGSGYQRLLDEIRRDAAIDRLYLQHLTVADVAHQLGFAEPRSFSRAFKQWTGFSPSAYQQRIDRQQADDLSRFR